MLPCAQQRKRAEYLVMCHWQPVLLPEQASLPESGWLLCCASCNPTARMLQAG